MNSYLAAVVTAAVLNAQAADIVFADFEGDTYGDWKTTGTAFGDGPARGTLPGQMPVTVFRGRGLVNSFRGGACGTDFVARSPLFTQLGEEVALQVAALGPADVHYHGQPAQQDPGHGTGTIRLVK